MVFLSISGLVTLFFVFLKQVIWLFGECTTTWFKSKMKKLRLDPPYVNTPHPLELATFSGLGRRSAGAKEGQKKGGGSHTNSNEGVFFSVM